MSNSASTISRGGVIRWVVLRAIGIAHFLALPFACIFFFRSDLFPVIVCLICYGVLEHFFYEGVRLYAMRYRECWKDSEVTASFDFPMINYYLTSALTGLACIGYYIIRTESMSLIFNLACISIVVVDVLKRTVRADVLDYLKCVRLQVFDHRLRYLDPENEDDETTTG